MYLKQVRVYLVKTAMSMLRINWASALTEVCINEGLRDVMLMNRIDTSSYSEWFNRRERRAMQYMYGMRRSRGYLEDHDDFDEDEEDYDE